MSTYDNKKTEDDKESYNKNSETPLSTAHAQNTLSKEDMEKIIHIAETVNIKESLNAMYAHKTNDHKKNKGESIIGRS